MTPGGRLRCRTSMGPARALLARGQSMRRKRSPSAPVMLPCLQVLHASFDGLLRLPFFMMTAFILSATEVLVPLESASVCNLLCSRLAETAAIQKVASVLIPCLQRILDLFYKGLCLLKGLIITKEAFVQTALLQKPRLSHRRPANPCTAAQRRTALRLPLKTMASPTLRLRVDFPALRCMHSSLIVIMSDL